MVGVRVHQTPRFSKDVEHCFCHQNLFVTYPITIYHANFEVHLRSSRGPGSTLKFVKSPEPPPLLSKLQNCRTDLIVRSFESSWRDKDTLNVAELSVFDTCKVIHENEITATAILFFVCISQKIGYSVLSLSKTVFLVRSFRMSKGWALYDNYENLTLL